MITRRKFFSFFGTGVVMAVAPQIIPATLADLEYVTPGYGHGLVDTLMFLRYYDEMVRRIILGSIIPR